MKLSILSIVLCLISFLSKDVIAQEDCAKHTAGSYEHTKGKAAAGDKRALELMKMMETAKKRITVQKRGSNITNIELEGNLKSYNDIGCIPINSITTKISPADLFKGLKVCANKGEYATAASMYILARMYGSFDYRRVADKTAGQAIKVIQMNTFGYMPKERVAHVQKYLSENLSEGTKEKVSFCSTVQKIGYPTYHPDYMISHGIRAFTGIKGNGLEPDFDPESAWAEVLLKGCNIK